MKALIIIALSVGIAGAQTWQRHDHWIPNSSLFFVSSSSATNLDGTISQIAACGQYVNSDGTSKSIQAIGLRTGSTVTKSGGSGLTIALQDASTSSGSPIVPDMVDDQTVEVSNSAIPAANTPFETGSLSSNRSVSPGDLLCVVARWNSSGRQGSDVISFGTSGDVSNGFGVVRYTGSAWEGGHQSRSLYVYFIHSDSSYGYIVGAVPYTQAAFNLSSSTTPDEVALTVVPKYSTRVAAARYPVSAGQAHDFVVYNEAGDVLYSKSVAATAITTSVFVVSFPPIDLQANSLYRFAIKPTTTTAYTQSRLDFYSANLLDLPGMGGSNNYYSSRTDGGSWSNNTTARPGGLAILATHIQASGAASSSQTPIQ